MDTVTDSPMKAARLAKGWTLRHLAGVLVAEHGVSTAPDGSNLSRIERGVSPGPALRKALCDALDLKSADLP